MFIKIQDYKEGISSFNALQVKASHNRYRKTMEIEVVPVELHDGIIGRLYDFSDNPLTAGIMLARIPMPRKNQKKIDAAQKDLDGMAEKIADLWNKRDFDSIRAMFA